MGKKKQPPSQPSEAKPKVSKEPKPQDAAKAAADYQSHPKFSKFSKGRN